MTGPIGGMRATIPATAPRPKRPRLIDDQMTAPVARAPRRFLPAAMTMPTIGSASP